MSLALFRAHVVSPYTSVLTSPHTFSLPSPSLLSLTFNARSLILSLCRLPSSLNYQIRFPPLVQCQSLRVYLLRTLSSCHALPLPLYSQIKAYQPRRYTNSRRSYIFSTNPSTLKFNVKFAFSLAHQPAAANAADRTSPI